MAQPPPKNVDEYIAGFPPAVLSTPVPVRLIARIAKFRAREVAEREKAKRPAAKKR